MSKLLGVIIGLALANFMYQCWFLDIANYAVATKRSWFQSIAVVWYHVYLKFTKE